MGNVNVAKSGKTLTKADIAMKVYDKIGFSKKEAAELVEMVFDMMKKTVCRGDKLKISGFGNFELRDKKQRRGRNPKTGDSMMISARRVLTFHPSQILRKRVNKEELDGTEERDEFGGNETPM